MISQPMCAYLLANATTAMDKGCPELSLSYSIQIVVGGIHTGNPGGGEFLRRIENARKALCLNRTKHVLPLRAVYLFPAKHRCLACT